MTNRVVNLNKLASALCGESTKVRVRIVGSALQIRPTDRKIAKGLPKGEILVDLKTRADRGTKRFTLPENIDIAVLASGTKFSSTETKHGWIAFEVVEALEAPIGQAAPAGGSVTAA